MKCWRRGNHKPSTRKAKTVKATKIPMMVVEIATVLKRIRISAAIHVNKFNRPMCAKAGVSTRVASSSARRSMSRRASRKLARVDVTFGDLDLSTVSGSFHFAPDKAMTKASQLGHMTVSELVAFTFQSFNVSHSISALSFGDHFPGIESPLDGVTRHVMMGMACTSTTSK